MSLLRVNTLENLDGTFSVDVEDLATLPSLSSTVLGSEGGRSVGYKYPTPSSIPRNVQFKLSETISVKDFGAVGDGVTDDTAAFNLAVAYANSRGAIDFGGVTGTTIKIPDGRYVLGAVTPVTRSGCEFVGESRNGTVLLLTSNTTAFTFGNGVDIVVGGGVSNLKVEYLTLPGAASRVFACDLAYRCTFTDILVVNIGVLVRLGITSARACGGIRVNNIDGSKANVACALFEVNFGAGLFVSNTQVFVPVPFPVHPASMTTVPGCNVFNCFTGFWDTIQCVNCIFERFDQGLSVVAGNTMVYQNMFFSNTIMDYFRRYCVYLQSDTGGVVAGVRFDNASWFVSWETSAIEILGVGYNDNHNFSGKVVIAGAAGVNYSLASSRNVTFANMQLNSCNRLGTAQGAMTFAANSGGFTVIGCKGNVDTTGIGLPWRAPFGIVVAADADRFVVNSNAFEGSTGGYSFGANAAGSGYRSARGNANANYNLATGFALPATGVPLTNTSPFVMDVHIHGGTVSSITRNGAGLTGMTSGFVGLDPGQTITVGYTVAPSFSSFFRA